MVRPPAGFVAAAERDGIETVSVTNVVSAPAINKIGSLFNTLNKTVTGALNSIITGAPVAPGGSQTQPMSTALSPLPAWRAPQRPPGAFTDHVPLQRFQPPPQHVLPHVPVVRTISYDSQYHQQQPQSVPSSVYWPAVDAQPSYTQVIHVDQIPAQPSSDWYSQSTQPTVVNQATDSDRRVLTAAPVSDQSLMIGLSAHPSAFSRVDSSAGRGDWESLPDMDRRPPAPPSPVYSNASSTCFIPPTDRSTTRFGSTPHMPLLPNHFSGKSFSHIYQYHSRI